MVQSVDAFLLVVYLLPGFLGLLVFEALAEVKRRHAAEKISLIVFFAVASMLLLSIFVEVNLFPDVDAIKKNPDVLSGVIKGNIFYASIASILMAVLFATLANKRTFYKFAKCVGISNRTGAIDPWHEVFSNHRKVWVQIRFNDGSRLVGWPKWYSEEGENREIFLAKATWHFPLDPPSQDPQSAVAQEPRNREVDVEGYGVLITNFSNVKSVEILKGTDDG